ncbi:AAA family ATPase, partial [Micromonospora sp. WMMD736]|uniref:AAA family ATPase n=1 Tax=Micromonospora sp. WMMD736 TaxID=3404112 RepID=UPI003B93C191
MISGDPLTGREHELAAIRRALSGGGKHCGVVIVGAAGVGKTRLAREVLSRATAAGDRTTWVVGTESARQLPLGAFTASITETLSSSPADALPNVRRVINSFVPADRKARVLVGVDDAHLLDGLSAHVVHQLAQARGVRLVVTSRAGAEEPDAVTALWKDGHLARLDLEPLSVESTTALIETVLGGPVDRRSARRFWKLTGGNALYLRQLLTDQVAAGRMRQVADVWMWDGDVVVSQGITDMVGHRLGRLTPELARIVDLLALCEPLRLEVLTDLVDRRDLETAEQMRLVTVERGTAGWQTRLAHPLFGELRRSCAGEMYLSGLRGKLAQRLAADPDTDMQATVRRALLTIDSDLPPDPELYLTAARYAMTLLDPDMADRLARAAADCGAPEAAPMRAMTNVLLGRGAAAEEILRDISAERRPDHHHWATIRATNLIWMLGRPADAADILDGLANAPETETEVAERTAIQACVDAVAGRVGVAAQEARTALDSGLLSDFHAMMAAVAAMMAFGALGRVDDIPDLASQAIERASTSFQSSQMRFWFGSVHARACRLTGRIEDCVTTAAALNESARDVPGVAYANLAHLLGHADLARGAVTEAAKRLHEARAGVHQHGVTSGLHAACCFGLAEAHAKLGESDAAKSAQAEAHKCVPTDYVYMQTNLALATGWALASGGALTEAIAEVQRAAAEARDRGQPTHELACLQAAGQWGDSSGAGRASELADELALPIAGCIAGYLEALAANDGAGLLSASGKFEALGDRVTAADAAAQAGVAYTRDGHRKRGLYAAAVAQRLAE